jgi:hypothetical protein
MLNAEVLRTLRFGIQSSQPFCVLLLQIRLDVPRVGMGERILVVQGKAQGHSRAEGDLDGLNPFPQEISKATVELIEVPHVLKADSRAKVVPRRLAVKGGAKSGQRAEQNKATRAA